MSAGGSRGARLGSLSLGLFGLGGWLLVNDDVWLGAFLIVVGAVAPIAELVRRSGARAEPFGIPSVAMQPAILVLLAVALGVGEVAGIGFRRDIGRGVLVLLGSLIAGYGVFLLARAFRSHD